MTGIELTEDDFVESYDADKYYLQISKIFDSEKQCKDFENQILQNKEDAEKLQEFYDNFPRDKSNVTPMEIIHALENHSTMVYDLYIEQYEIVEHLKKRIEDNKTHLTHLENQIYHGEYHTAPNYQSMRELMQNLITENKILQKILGGKE